MPSFNGSVLVAVNGELVSPQDIGESVYKIPFTAQYNFTNGTGANQANTAFSDRRTLLASASENLDLNGVLQTAFGTTLALTKIKFIQVYADPSNINDVLVGGAATNAASSFFNASTDTLRIKPGGSVSLTAPDANGYGITAATADILKIANSGAGTPVTYTINIIGVE